MKTAPAFMMYASDTMADRNYRLMSLEERGLFLSLLCECWVNRAVPTDSSGLAKLLGFPVDTVRTTLTERVLSFFERKGGEIQSAELERYRKTLEDRRDRMSQGGKKGAQIKWRPVPSGDGHPNGVSIGSRVEMSREEKNRGESLIKGVTSIDDAWVKDYDKAAERY
jgi:hypothetical protein